MSIKPQNNNIIIPQTTQTNQANEKLANHERYAHCLSIFFQVNISSERPRAQFLLEHCPQCLISKKGPHFFSFPFLSPLFTELYIFFYFKKKYILTNE